RGSCVGRNAYERIHRQDGFRGRLGLRRAGGGRRGLWLQGLRRSLLSAALLVFVAPARARALRPPGEQWPPPPSEGVELPFRAGEGGPDSGRNGAPGVPGTASSVSGPDDLSPGGAGYPL